MAGGPGAWLGERNGKPFVRYRDGDGRSSSRTFEDERSAVAFRDGFNALVRAEKNTRRTVSEAISAYEKHLAAEGHKQATETLRRLRAFFESVLELEVRALTPALCEALYDQTRERKVTRWVGSGEKRKLVELDRPVSPNTHRGMLTHSKTFLKWLKRKKWIKTNPLAEVEPSGELRHGKPQLRIDEARRWYSKAAEMGQREAGALAAATALLLGLRASEITRAQVRDLDDEGRLLWIPLSKTAAGRRTLEVPAALRPLLAKLAEGRAGDALLFGGQRPRDGGATRPHNRGWVREWTQRICELAGVPAVSAHSLRGLHATLALQAGATSELVAGALGHASDAVTLGSYAAPGAAAAGRQGRVLGVLDGGKK